ncbi:hypothetical protein GNZ12_03670 [Paraburkholderia sp. 1N]|uniref:Leucine rich repeat variant n=1 Tax=Paraburkholderia solitsugae TaxID=2675748 RepID=A0ABX2BJT3_9BURK|nr:hypothetical protein [Paraburkholderia solitsugae]NPT40426.1 hypothetical protein [Paraburkholderia solitsugae]
MSTPVADTGHPACMAETPVVRTTTTRRHWRELIGLALDADDVYGAAALYPYARAADRERLGARLFGTRRERLALAAFAFAPPAVLAQLAALAAAQHDETLKLRLARNPSTPDGALDVLAAAAQPVPVRLSQLLARHAHAPHALLASIAAHTDDVSVLHALCENVGVPSNLLTQLEQRGIAMLQRVLAIHLATDAQTLLRLWKTTRASAVRAQVLRHPYCPDTLLHTMPASVAERRSLALHPRAPANALVQLARDDDAAVRRATALNVNTPTGALIALCFDAQASVRRAVAVRDDIPLKVVDWLADDADAWVRRALARNPACPGLWLERFVKDSESEVRRAVSRHPRCPAHLLAMLADDAVPWVRAGVAYRDDLARAVLHRLTADQDIDVLSGVARNPATPQAQLARLAAHPVPDVRRGVILNRHASRRVLLRLRDEAYPLHRVLVFEHPNLTDADRWRMRFDPDSEARARIFGHLGRTLGPVGSAASATSTTKGRRHAHSHAISQPTSEADSPQDSTQHEPPYPHYPTNMMEPR